MTIETVFESYKIFLEGLTAENLEGLAKYVTEDVRFRDPFHNTRGLPKMQNIFRQLFDNVKAVKFIVSEYAISGRTVFFNWKLDGVLFDKPWKVEGVTRIQFDENGKVTHHFEYWDAASQLYEHMPIIGWVVRFFRRQISKG